MTTDAARLAATDADAPTEIFLDPERRRTVQICLWILGVLGTGSLIGVAASLYLVNHAPLLLIALSPLGRHLILAAPTVSPVAFVVVAVARRLLFYVACFHLGRALGPAGIVWIERRAGGFARFVRWLEDLFQRFGLPIVLLFPGPTVSALAGISGMRQVVFAALAIPGLVLRMLIIVGFAEWLRAPIETLLAWIDEHWVPGTVVMVVGVLAYRAWQQRSLARQAEAKPSEPAV